jgi:repressor LexA
MLTPMQRRAFELIAQRLGAEGVAPTRTEMMAALGLRSKSGAQRLVEALIERGYLRRLPHRARAIEILRRPGEARPSTPARATIQAALALDEAQGLALARELVARAVQPASIPDLAALRALAAEAQDRLARLPEAAP